MVVFERLRNVFDDTSLMALLSDYEQKCHSIVIDMLVDIDDRETVKRGAHELRAMSNQLGFGKLSLTLQTIETENLDQNALLPLIADLCKTLKISLSSARQHLAR